MSPNPHPEARALAEALEHRVALAIYGERVKRGEGHATTWGGLSKQSRSVYMRQARAALAVADAAGWEKRSPAGEAELRDALEPFALLAADLEQGIKGAEMSDPLSKWFTIAQLQAARVALSTRPAGESAGMAEATGLSWSGTAVTIDFAHSEHAKASFRALDAARASQPPPAERASGVEGGA